MNKQQKSNQPFRLLLLGRSGTGKSYNGVQYILQLLKDKLFQADRVVIFSKTWQSDPSQKPLVDYCEEQYKGWKKHNAFEQIDTKFLQELFQSQKHIKETDPKNLQPWLIFVDDQIGERVLTSKDQTLIELFAVGRHWNVSQIWGIQRFRGTISPTMRDQFTEIAIFKVPGKKSLQDLLMEIDESPEQNHKESLKQLYNNYQDAIQSNSGHGCLVVHQLVSYGQGRLEKNLGSGVFYDK